MCFSAEASFGSAVFLQATGVFLTQKCFRNGRVWTSLIPLSLVPTFFGFQQAAEGCVWLSLHREGWRAWGPTAEIVYLSFAYCFWPIWLPLSLLLMERVPWRKWAIRALLVMGTIIGVSGIHLIAGGVPDARIIQHSVCYGDLSWSIKIPYLVAVAGPFLVSSLSRMWTLGVLSVLSFILSSVIFMYAFTSVWCFFAAALCFVFYGIMRGTGGNWGGEGPWGGFDAAVEK